MASLSYILKRKYDFGELGIDGNIVLKWDWRVMIIIDTGGLR